MRLASVHDSRSFPGAQFAKLILVETVYLLSPRGASEMRLSVTSSVYAVRMNVFLGIVIAGVCVRAHWVQHAVCRVTKRRFCLRLGHRAPVGWGQRKKGEEINGLGDDCRLSLSAKSNEIIAQLCHGHYRLWDAPLRSCLRLDEEDHAPGRSFRGFS